MKAASTERSKTGTHSSGPTAWPTNRNDKTADNAPPRFLGTIEAPIFWKTTITKPNIEPAAA